MRIWSKCETKKNHVYRYASIYNDQQVNVNLNGDINPVCHVWWKIKSKLTGRNRTEKISNKGKNPKTLFLSNLLLQSLCLFSDDNLLRMAIFP